MAVLNSNPEILLRKRKNADRKRLEKQEQAREKLLKVKSQKKKQAQNKFIRAETLISNHKFNELERKRIKNLSKKNKAISASATNDDNEDNQDTDYKLLFIIRVPNHTKGLKVPAKASKLLHVLKLTQVNTGVFIRANELTYALLNLIAPYVIIGKPTLNSIRKLFQKRACVLTYEEDEEGQKTAKITKLDNNQLVEDQFGDSLGLICIEDLIHEITNLSDNLITITSWLLPFKLNQPVNGWGPQAKLAKLLHSEENKKSISLSQDFKLTEVEDIDAIIVQQN